LIQRTIILNDEAKISMMADGNETVVIQLLIKKILKNIQKTFLKKFVEIFKRYEEKEYERQQSTHITT
jgi:hypothetical protein